MNELFDRLVGGWTLISARHEFDNGEVADMYGPLPVGSIVFTGQGRMMAILTSSARTPESPSHELFQSMMSYTGRFKLIDAELITIVDAAWIPNWVGSQQRRYATIDGDELSIRTDRHNDHPLYLGKWVVGLIVWRKDIPD